LELERTFFQQSKAAFEEAKADANASVSEIGHVLVFPTNLCQSFSTSVYNTATPTSFS